MSPFLTCFPLLPTAEPYGQGNTRLSHIKRRRLIMPLVALVQKTERTSDCVQILVLGAPFLGALRLAFRHATSKCLYKNASNRPYVSKNAIN